MRRREMRPAAVAICLLLLSACARQKEDAEGQGAAGRAEDDRATLTDKMESGSVPPPPLDYSRLTIEGGVYGRVFVQEFEDMVEDPEGNLEPHATRLEVHAPTRPEQLQFSKGMGGTFITGVSSPLVASAAADSTGFFQIALPPGRYSLFAVEEGRLIPNHLSSSGDYSAFDVPPEGLAFFRFIINY